MKNVYLFALLILGQILLNSCKKDQLNIDREKTYIQTEPKIQATNSYFGGWSLTLKLGNSADINPGGDISYRGTYKISGSTLKVKTDNDSFTFKILSATDIQSEKYNVLLRLKN